MDLIGKFLGIGPETGGESFNTQAIDFAKFVISTGLCMTVFWVTESFPFIFALTLLSFLCVGSVILFQTHMLGTESPRTQKIAGILGNLIITELIAAGMTMASIQI